MGNSYLKFFLYTLLSILIHSYSLAQFNSGKIDLIETTFKRQFDKNTITKYFNSSDSTDVIAALISVSHSEDTSFVEQITKLDFDKYGKWISFALGQIGNSETAIKYLWDKLADNDFHYSEQILCAIGKKGSAQDLNRLIKTYYTSENKNSFNGIEEAFLQFGIRNIKETECKKILTNEILYNDLSVKRLKKSLFTLARLGSDSSVNKFLKDILIKNEDIEMLQLVLMNLRTQKYFFDNPLDFVDNIKNKDAVMIEFLETVHYSKNNENVLKIFSDFLLKKDINENLLIETLKSFRLKNWESSLINKFQVKAAIEKIIATNKKNIIVHEAVKTYSSLFGNDILLKSEKLKDRIYGINKIYLLLKGQNVDFTIISKLYDEIIIPKEKLIALELILDNQSKLLSDNLFTLFVLNSLNSEEPASISIIADGIDSIFVNQNKESLKKIISLQTGRFKDNPNFLESLISLLNLSKKIHSQFYNQIVKKLSNTKMYSLRKYLSKLNPEIKPPIKNPDNLREIISNAFTYSSATIFTNKGAINLQLNPEYTPITVGNFVLLALKEFYNNLTFHRVVPGFVIQGGDPTGTGWGGPGYEIISEFSPDEFNVGAVGIASAGKDTEGSQFFIMQGYYPHLNGRYSLFARVTEGFDVLMKISEDDRILSIQIHK